ncbi:unnamed protein product [Closterium sp. NIES-53]
MLDVDDYTRYTTVFPLCTKGEVPDVLIPWIRAIHLQLHERFRQDLPVVRLHSDRGGEFSSDLLRDFCRGEGILQSFTLPESPQQNGIAERRIGLVMEVDRTSIIHAATPHFLWPFAVRYAAHQLKLWPRLSLLETSPTLRWTGEVGNASVFRVWGSRAFVLLPPHLAPCPFTISSPTPLPPPPPPPAPAALTCFRPSLWYCACRGSCRLKCCSSAELGGAESNGAGSGGAETRGEEPGGAEPAGVELGGPAGASPRLSLRQLREWLVRRARLWSGATGAVARGAGVTAGAGGTGGTVAAGHGGAHTRGAGAATTGGVGGAGARDPTEPGATGAGGSCAGAGAARAGAADPRAGGAGGTVRPRPYFVPLLQQVLGVPSSPSLTPPLLCPLLDQSQPPLLSASPLPAPSPYTEQSGGLTERREPASRLVSPVRSTLRIPCSRPPPVPGMHTMALRPSSVPLRVPLPAPSESSPPEVPDPDSDRACAANPIVSRLLASAVTDPSFESAAASALVAELLEFAAACRLDYATAC